MILQLILRFVERFKTEQKIICANNFYCDFIEFFLLGFTTWKAKQLLRGVELQEKEVQKNCLESTYR